METKDLLRVEIDRIIGAMGKMEVNSEEYKMSADVLSKLIDRLDELDKSTIQWSAQAQEDERQAKELKLKQEQLEHEKKVHEDEEIFREKQAKGEKIKVVINTIVTVLGFAVPAGVTVWGTIKSLKFEETGTYTSAMKWPSPFILCGQIRTHFFKSSKPSSISSGLPGANPS